MVGPDPPEGNLLRLSTSPALDERCGTEVTWFHPQPRADIMGGDMIVEHGRLSGIISIGDLVKHRVSELEAEERLMHDYTATDYSVGRF